MNIGVIIPVCVQHGHQPDCWVNMRQYSRPETPIYVLFNGMDPVSLPENVQTLHVPERFPDEADLWQYCLEFAQAQGWDWCMVCHDDFQPREPGWEADLEQSAGWRVALAAWRCCELWDDWANPGNPTSAKFGVVLDSYAWAFRVDLFTERGCVCEVRWAYGYGAWDAVAWALRNDYAIWKIHGDSWHQWLLASNTRTVLQLGANGHPESRERYADVLPAKVLDAEHMQVKDRIVRVAP